jgi:hypothetical protein
MFRETLRDLEATGAGMSAGPPRTSAQSRPTNTARAKVR